ncbi:MAG: substrate-binding domain-containing protein [Nitrososphaerota archaeon]|nr:substrate-binding domain-containing protein [Candidatus Bathyarchaeota archaeon]MDW8023691.1 substrate-binding domain-containing protein [Nitrososphaerota archaeon]
MSLGKAAAFLIISLILGALGMAVFYGYGSSATRRIIIFAGAAASPVYREACRIFEERSNVKVELRLGGSGSLLSAMKIAKVGDVYIPGSPEYLVKAKNLRVVNFTAAPARIFAYLVPAILVQKGNPKGILTLEDLAKPGIRVGIADPESVCVGLYAKDLLEANGLWESVKKNIAVHAESCEATATLIFTGAVDAIIGWHVFYHWSPEKAEIVWIEPNRIPKIGYIAGAVTEFAENKDLAAGFLDFLASRDMHELWARYGYIPTLEEARLYAPNAAIEEV